MKFHEEHPLLDTDHLQMVPGGDGEVFNPPLKLKLLILDQSHIIAERFEIEDLVQRSVKFTIQRKDSARGGRL